MATTFDLNIKATPEQIAGAVFGSLLATVQSLYMMQVISMVNARFATDAAHAITTGKFSPEDFENLDRKITLDIRRGRLAFAYELVIDPLPTDSPFRAPLEQRRDLKVAAME
jgi:hypothetical protein